MSARLSFLRPRRDGMQVPEEDGFNEKEEDKQDQEMTSMGRSVCGKMHTYSLEAYC